jgi:plastocyanin
MNSNKTVTAAFAPIAVPTYTLAISATNGSVTQRVNGVVTTATSFAHGTVVQLTATPNTGYTFGSWSGSVAGTANPVSVTMNGVKSVTATFTANVYTLAVSADNGTVVKSPDKATYAYGDTVTLTTTAAVGYAFGSWSGSAAGTATSVTLVMNSNKAVTATFELIPGIEPVAHWVFDEPYRSTAADIVSGQSALLVNDPAWGEGWAGEHFVRLDSGRQAVQIPLGQCNSAAGTITLWVLPENSNGTQVLFSHGLIGAANSILLYQNAGRLAVGVGDAHQDNIATLTVGQMHHVAVTWNGTSYAVTVNGLQEAAGTFGGLTQLNDFAKVGNYSDPATYDSTPGFRGIIDDVQLYSQSLSTAQINALFLAYTVRENRSLTFVISGQDLSGNPIVYTAQNLPQGAVFDSQTQTFAWRPALYRAAGRYPLTFTAAGQPDQTVTVSVRDVTLAGWYEQFLTRSGKY